MKKLVALFLSLCLVLGSMAFASAEAVFTPGTYEAVEMGFGGDIKVMTALDNDGNILKVKVTDASDETPGLGSKTTTEAWFTDQFAGKSEVTDYQAITGASFSSRGVYNGVAAALAQFAAL